METLIKRKLGHHAEGDEHMARELKLFIGNDGDLYRQQTLPIIKNLMRKRKKGVYDSELAVKLWGYLMESGAKKYAKEFGGTWHEMFSPATREIAAREFARDFEIGADGGEYAGIDLRIGQSADNPHRAETDREWVEKRQAAPEAEGEYRTEYTADDFDRWFLEGGSWSDPVTSKDQSQLFDNLMYLTQAEDRRLVQSLPDLRNAIRVWAAAWNERIHKTAPAPRQQRESNPRRSYKGWRIHWTIPSDPEYYGEAATEEQAGGISKYGAEQMKKYLHHAYPGADIDVKVTRQRSTRAVYRPDGMPDDEERDNIIAHEESTWLSWIDAVLGRHVTPRTPPAPRRQPRRARSAPVWERGKDADADEPESDGEYAYCPVCEAYWDWDDIGIEKGGKVIYGPDAYGDPPYYCPLGHDLDTRG